MTRRTTPDKQTKDAERREAARGHGADRGPTPEEEQRADATPVNRRAADAERRYNTMAAKAKGEGRI